MLFTYTDKATDLSVVNGGRSEFVDSLYYNSLTRELVVGLLNEDEEESFYRYENVPDGVFQAFHSAPSLGRFYNLGFKPTYGPAVHEDGYLQVERTRQLSTVGAVEDTGNSTGPHLSWPEPEQVKPARVPAMSDDKEAATYEYIVVFTVGYSETEARIEAVNDLEAEQAFINHVEALGLDYEISSISREF